MGFVLKQMSSKKVQVWSWFVISAFKSNDECKAIAEKKNNQKQTMWGNFRFHSGLFFFIAYFLVDCSF